MTKKSDILFPVIVAWMLFITYILCTRADAFTKRAPVAEPSPIVSPVATASPSPIPPVLSPGTFVVLGQDLGPSVRGDFAARALALMNRAYANGCLRSGIEHHNFSSLNTVFEVSPITPARAAEEYLKHAPYALDLRWYYKWTSKVIGYTYNFRDDNWDAGSETRIWSNTKYIGTDPKPYAAHLAHELSHQARAGGYVHYTVFGGSFPYDVGDIMALCLMNL